jgi:deoxyribodipyrimidine photo-lyase
MKNNPVIFWFRSDLRLADNPALAAACGEGRPVIPVYILDDVNPGAWKMGGASRWWLHQSLQTLSDSLEAAGFQPLVLLKGDAEKELLKLAAETKADTVYWNRRYEPWAVARDTKIKAELKDKDIEAASFNGYLLFEPWQIKNKTGQSYKVFTPYSKACMELSGTLRPVLTGKLKTKPFEKPVRGLPLDKLGLMPSIKWYGGMARHWEPGEAGAQKRLKVFLKEDVEQYTAQRDFPAIDGVSMMSPYLHFGEISPHQIWHACAGKKAQPYLRQLLWREFSWHLLHHSPDFPEQPWNKKFTGFSWKEDFGALKKWQKGMTGYPIIDAGMRQLWETGWMHNRVRMIVGSFLVKNLLIHWRHGEDWFWDTLVDADLGNNAAGWQWIAGCGADAAPYFRIFNPVTQSERFDPKGEYIRRFVPELKDVPDEFIHAPWEAPPMLRPAKYPAPIVDLAKSRERALAAYAELKENAA